MNVFSIRMKLGELRSTLIHAPHLTENGALVAISKCLKLPKS